MAQQDPNIQCTHLTRTDIFDIICSLLSNQVNNIPWGAFTPPEWALFCEIAREESVDALLYGIIKDVLEISEFVNSEVMNTLRSAYYAASARNQIIYQALERVLELFDGSNIPVVVLKGTVLAKTIYPDFAFRRMNDIDLLVTPRDLPRAIKTLNKNRYIQDKISYHAIFRERAEGAIPIEIHWAMIPNDMRPTWRALDWFWERTQPFPGSHSARMLNVEAHLLFLVGHLMVLNRGERMGLLWYYDLYLLIFTYREQINWESAIQQAEKLGWLPAFKTALQTLHARFGSKDIADIINTMDIDAYETKYQHISDPKSLYLRQSFEVLGWKPRITLLLGLFFPSPAYIRWRYKTTPTWLWPLSYIVRMRDILRARL